MKYKKTGHYKILNKINNNSYKVDLPVDLENSTMFNIFYLYIFLGDDMGDDKEVEVDWKQAISRNKKEKIVHILDEETLRTQQGQYNRYLVQWEGLAPSEST